MYNFENYDELMLKYSFALEMIETELKIMIKNYEYKTKSSPVDHIKSRLKSKDSIIKKLKKKNYEITEENIINHVHDIIGIRIVCAFVNDVYDIVKLIKENSHFKIKEERDYINNPKATGYISYHIIISVPVFLDGEEVDMEAEIQIRTIAMDFWAALDHKISYKFEELPAEVKSEMYNCSLDIKAIDEKMYKLNCIAQKYRD